MSTYPHEQLTRELGLQLGQATAYPQQFEPGLLHAVPRKLARDTLALDGTALPFDGVDLWTGYELSWLDLGGKPQVAIAEFSLPCSSPAIIESKSFKLFLNSLNQSHFADWQQVEHCLKESLSRCAGAPVTVNLLPPNHFSGATLVSLPGESLDNLPLQDVSYNYDPTLLHVDGQRIVSETLMSDLLKSNCLITNQPDWGSVMIRYQGPAIDREGLLRYLISFRAHNEFHEQCVERIFVDLMRHCRPQQLTVYARYTRRGGLDINPYRSNFEQQPPAGRLARQ
ncbi:MAG: NADPH-dependent 7-cyano-7-deazaguanine reductase QueF [Gammaproteobacteria bacterium]|nr:NADPH-dependent 7-cyano-7-deazaguanine reductase QueF [Gammaproteobacteria bacterium]